MSPFIIRAPILNPAPSGRVRFHSDGVLAADAAGRITFAGDWSEFAGQGGVQPVTRTFNLLVPAFLDAHIHIPQFPIRGRFDEGIPESTTAGRLLAGLNKNVFPAEAKNQDESYAVDCVRQFRSGTLAQGVVGGCAYMTVHARATKIALGELGSAWSVGMVLMNQNCPEYLRTSEPTVEEDLRHLAQTFGRRCVITDRFAVAVNSELRTFACRLASELGLGTQTHLNEQRPEKEFVERDLYPHYNSYTDVYHRDGLLRPGALLAHCIWMGEEEWLQVRDSGSGIVHCPTSNTLLGSGVMNRSEVGRLQIPYALCTDVGASPSTSLLAEMTEFLSVHPDASAEEALFRCTLAPAQLLNLDGDLGSLERGKSLTYVEIDTPAPISPSASAEQVIRTQLLDWAPDDTLRPLRDELARGGITEPHKLQRLKADFHRRADRLEGKVLRVVVDGREAYRRDAE